MTIHIRTMTLEDVQFIGNLMIQLGYPATAEQLRTRFQNILSLNDYETFVAVLGNEIVGLLGVAKQFAYEFDGPYARVLALVVSEQHRRKQIGNKLMDAAEQWATKQGCHIITLNSGNREERETAHRFYTKIGYIGKSTGFSKKLEL